MQVDSFFHDGREVVYEVHGHGPRTLVYVHGLLLDAALNRMLAQPLADAGYRVVLPELTGHGRSDKPLHATEYRLDRYAEQVVGLLDHLEIDQAVVGGVSLGANVTLTLAATAPQRCRALVCEMPVLERGAVAAISAFTPALLALRYGGRAIRPLTRLAARAPRSGVHAADAFLQAASADPREMAAVLHGLLVSGGPPPEQVRRRIDLPTLVIGHEGDLLHPLDDAVALAGELPAARLVRAFSVVEARLFPTRIVGELATFLDEVWPAAA